MRKESYWNGLLEYPQYTRPEVWEGRAVPPILLSGNHKAVDDWRGEQSRQRTRERRPDLWEAYLAAGGWDGTPLPKKPSRHRKRSPLRRPPPRRKPARKRRRNSRRRTEPRAQLVPTC